MNNRNTETSSCLHASIHAAVNTDVLTRVPSQHLHCAFSALQWQAFASGQDQLRKVGRPLYLPLERPARVS